MGKLYNKYENQEVSVRVQEKTERLQGVVSTQSPLDTKEEAVLRMRHGIAVREVATLPFKTNDAKMLGALHDMELEAFIASGRLEELFELGEIDFNFEAEDETIANPVTRLIVEKLKK